MRHYIRARRRGATYFFTVNLQQRDGNRMLVERIADLRASFEKVRREHPFKVEAIVVLPEHLHAMWTLPVEDADFSTRWALIKAQFSGAIAAGEPVSPSRARRRERGIWQRRFYEQMIRDDRDFDAHVNYIHWNPVKHGHVVRIADWPYSSFHSYVRRGCMPFDWAGE
jgi:putative transposase